MDKRKKATSGKPQITIVIGTLNRPSVVLTLIRQLEKLRSSIEVLVIDQSTTENYAHLKDTFPDRTAFKLIHFNVPNTCKYLNYGWRNARADVVLYLDDDVSITERTVQAHLHEYRDPKVNGVAGRVINDGEKISLNGKVGRVNWYGASFKKNFTYDGRCFVDFPYGCNMSFRKGALSKLKGFDERLSPPMFTFNEIDMGIRVNRLWPRSIVFAPQALAYHHQYPRGGTRDNFDKTDVYKGNNYNYGYFVGKNYGAYENLLFFVRRTPYQLLREPHGIRSIMKGFFTAKKFKERL